MDDLREKVIHLLKQCLDDWPYAATRVVTIMHRIEDAVAILEKQEVPDNGGWISVKDKMPQERETIFTKLKGTKQWNPNMFMKSSDDVRVAVRFEDGTRMVSHDHTFDGKWYSEKEEAAYPKRTVTHWMPNPELPKEKT